MSQFAERRHSGWDLYVLAGLVSMGLALVFEPAQLAYVMPALLVIWLVEIALQRPRTINAFRAQLRVPALFAGLGLAIGCMTAAVLAVTGQLQGVVAFNRTLGAVAEYSALPTSLPSTIRLAPIRFGCACWPALPQPLGFGSGFRLPATS